MSFNELASRLFHWGPILALSCVNCITFCTLHVTSMWLPPFASIPGTIVHLIFLCLVGLTLYNFFCAMFIGPGYVPLGWKPVNPDHFLYLQYCFICKGYKAPRAHHCRKCNRCVMKMDHHCPWINNCCGHMNHSKFTWFMASAVFGCIYACVLLSIALYRAFNFNWYYIYGDRQNIVYLSVYTLSFAVFSYGLALGVIIAVGGLLYIQMKSIILNETSIEDWIVAKAHGRPRPEGDVFIYPYDLGWWNNIKQVFWEPIGNGIDWKVADGCHQYTLTIEQLVQKEHKRARIKQYTIIRFYNGSWFPISKGLRTCLSPPCSDEQRIPLCVGDTVFVTRWRKHWLYGEKAHKHISALSCGNDIKGWFPRCCAIEFTNADCDVSKVSKKTL